MIPTFFNNTNIQLFEYVELDEEDFFGEKHEYRFKGEYNVDIQPVTPSSSQEIFGRIVQDTYKIYLNIDVPISDTDLIKVPDFGTFEIIGSVEKWNHLLHYQKAIIKKHRKEVIHYEHESES